MPNKANAKKAIRQDEKRAERNKMITDNIKYLMRKVRKSIEASQFDEATSFAKKSIAAIDRAMNKGIIKKNTGARKKSRLLASITRAKAVKK